jgi:ribosomal protein L11 methylase PrmA
VYCGPSGDETVIVDVVVVHIGEADAFGTGGADGTGFTIKSIEDVHPFTSLTVSV